MNRFLKYNVTLLMSALLIAASSGSVNAGNDERAGSAGATELLINPWARSCGWGGANSASIRGMEAQFLNVAGLAFTKKTELAFSYTNWLSGADININSFGLAQKVGQSGVFGLGVMSMNFGDIPITTVDNPEGGIGTYSPQLLNIGLSYAKEFSNRIYGGITVRMISQAISDVKASGVSFDAGIQYVTGFNTDKDNLKFGIALKNVGAPMKFSGDGLTFRGLSETGTPLSIEYKADKFELPSLLNIGITYDAKLAEEHRLSPAFNFTANSFTRNQYSLGLEYGFKTLFMLRAAYVMERGLFDDAERTTALTGMCAGLTIEVPLGKKGGRTIGFDYGFRATNPFDGCHSFGARINL